MSSLKFDNVTLKFGGITALNNVSFEVKPKSLYAIIGPNGAGKTSIFNCISGIYRPTEGDVSFGENNIKDLRPDQVADLGIARTFQNIRLFPQMSVLENLMVAQHNKLMKASGFTILGLFNAPSFVDKEKEAVEISKYWLDIIGPVSYTHLTLPTKRIV